MTSQADPQPLETASKSTRRAAIHRIQEELRQIIPEGVSLVDELIADRRAEGAREEAESQRSP